MATSPARHAMHSRNLYMAHVHMFCIVHTIVVSESGVGRYIKILGGGGGGGGTNPTNLFID